MVERGAPDDDDALVGSKADGERFVAVFEARAGEVWRYLAARLGARGADELLSEVFVRAFANRSRFDPKRGSARAWLYGIATNVCREQLRDERRSPSVSSDTATTGWSMDSSNRIAERRVLGAAIASLPDERQEVVVLIAAIGLSYQEAARALGVPVGTVRSRFFRARRQLRSALANERNVNDARSLP